jgi:hypothetical protein
MRRAMAVAPPPVDAAAMIPTSAAGRVPLFLFGTLMDLDLLTYLLQRPIDVEDLVPARIHGFRRARAAAASYPVLVTEPGGMVAGRLLRRVTVRDIARINHYESEEYRAECRMVVTWEGVETLAWIYLGLDHLAPAAEPWSLAEWRAVHKPGFFAACDAWMRDFELGGR